jgi:FixJ family two-component response regulator
VPGAKPTILVVEDDASMSQAITRILRAGGFEVVRFGCAEAALEAGLAKAADCLVLDIRLPGMSGFELFRQLAQDGSESPVIFITGHDEPGIREEAERLGASSFLAKPFPGRMLLEAVAQALSFH